LDLFIAFLFGCAVGPNYKPPQTSVGASFANNPTNAASADETALLRGGGASTMQDSTGSWTAP